MKQLNTKFSKSDQTFFDTIIKTSEFHQRQRNSFKLALATSIWLSLGLIWLPGFTKVRPIDLRDKTPGSQPKEYTFAPKPKEVLQLEPLRQAISKKIPMPEPTPTEPNLKITPLELPNPDFLNETVDFLEPSFPDKIPDSAPAVCHLDTIGIEPPVFLKKIPPLYPPRALSVGLEGSVILEATLTRGGTIRDIRIVQGLGKGRFGFEEAATKALQEWTFEPGKLNGQPVDIRMSLRVTFAVKR